jgi:YfiR/HmsC-like
VAVLKTARALGVLALLCLPAQAIPAPTEYQVKAVFLFNFARFVDWPALAFVNDSAPFNICVYGADPFGPGLDSVVQGESVGGRAFAIRRLRDTNELHDCQILYIARDAADEMGDILAALGQQSTLTVSDLDTTTRQKVMVRLMTVGGKIRLRVKVDAARAAHLTISSNLLRSAEIVP